MMRARATSAAATRERILKETTALLKTYFRSDIHLDDVASAAGVSVQTIMRLFGSRTALLEGAGKELERHISEQRDRAAPGDIDGAIAGLFDHYEEVGDVAIRNLAEENDPAVQPIINIGRVRHRQWVERHFAPQLATILALWCWSAFPPCACGTRPRASSARSPHLQGSLCACW